MKIHTHLVVLQNENAQCESVLAQAGRRCDVRWSRDMVSFHLAPLLWWDDSSYIDYHSAALGMGIAFMHHSSQDNQSPSDPPIA
jgi:hypothetical protein